MANYMRGPFRISEIYCLMPPVDLKKQVCTLEGVWPLLQAVILGKKRLNSCFVSLGVQPVPLQAITNENPSGPSLGTIPQARFMLVMLNMLTRQHGANSLNLLLNSGMLALTQTIMRLIGRQQQCIRCLCIKTAGCSFQPV